MTFDTFQKSIDFLKDWKSKHEGYPDSRDPSIREDLTQAGVIPQDLEKSLAALAAWREGKSGNYFGMSSFAHLIRNRTTKGMFRSHLSDQNQFPGMVKGEEYPDKADEDFARLLGNIEDILEGRVVDLTQGAIYAGSTEEWFKQLLQDSVNHPRTVLAAGKIYLK